MLKTGGEGAGQSIFCAQAPRTQAPRICRSRAVLGACAQLKSDLAAPQEKA